RVHPLLVNHLANRLASFSYPLTGLSQRHEANGGASLASAGVSTSKSRRNTVLASLFTIRIGVHWGSMVNKGGRARMSMIGATFSCKLPLGTSDRNTGGTVIVARSRTVCVSSDCSNSVCAVLHSINDLL